MIKRVISDLAEQFTNPQVQRDEWDIQGLMTAVADYIPLLGTLPRDEIAGMVSPEAIRAHLTESAIAAYEAKEATMQPEMLRQIERFLLLRIFDAKWIEHLHDIDALRDAIGLRAYGQKDPLQEYKREAYELFQNLLGAIQHDVVRQVFHAQVVYDVPPPPMAIHNMVLQGPEGIEPFDPTAEESTNA